MSVYQVSTARVINHHRFQPNFGEVCINLKQVKSHILMPIGHL
ncbi:AAEL017100-PA [Aedes aegypti]|uniref:AAEL017100-PA n=1 Tax=Aedes aegypti TaxID=7159 RepID=J9HZU6_AEDAE|nr:AAEL017100-PA [Aedes aegypti]